MAAWKWKKMLIVHMHVRTVIAWLAGKFQVSYESSQVDCACLSLVLDVTDYFGIKGKVQMLSEIKI